MGKKVNKCTFVNNIESTKKSEKNFISNNISTIDHSSVTSPQVLSCSVSKVRHSRIKIEHDVA